MLSLLFIETHRWELAIFEYTNSRWLSYPLIDVEYMGSVDRPSTQRCVIDISHPWMRMRMRIRTVDCPTGLNICSTKEASHGGSLSFPSEASSGVLKRLNSDDRDTLHTSQSFSEIIRLLLDLAKLASYRSISPSHLCRLCYSMNHRCV